MEPEIILGSSSKSRQDILREMGYKFDVETADIDESAIRREKPEDLVLALAEAKAVAILPRLAERISAAKREGRPLLLITADQVVVHEGNIREKPVNEEEARLFIEGYSRSPAQTVGSVMVTNLTTGCKKAGVDVAEVYFHPIPKSVIDSLIKDGSVYSCSGGLVVEHPLVSPLVEAMVGTLDGVMGLSKQLTAQLIKEAL